MKITFISIVKQSPNGSIKKRKKLLFFYLFKKNVNFAK